MSILNQAFLLSRNMIIQLRHVVYFSKRFKKSKDETLEET